MGIGRTDVEVLGTEECLRLLGTRSLGRMGLTIESLPAILPVCYVLDDDAVVVRVERGSCLAAATRQEIVAFEVDELDPSTGVGWSVLVRGVAREVSGQPFDPEAASDSFADWLDPTTSRYLSVSTDVISGRRVRSSRRA